jgi:outer membrane protein OmpA-like peptidoglycan-associated protein
VLPTLLAAALGAALCWYCVTHHAPKIQGDILSRTSQALSGAGLSAAGLSVDGRDAVLRGVRGSREVSAETQELVRNLWGVNSVRVELTEPPPQRTPAPAAVVSEVQTKIDDIIRLKNIEFATGSSLLTPLGAGTLNDVAAALAKSEALTVSISGHTDDQGNAVLNQNLSEARAGEVKRYLTSKGVAADRMTTAGYGQTKPIAGNATAEGRQRNRRIEFAVSGGGRAEVLPAR